MKSWIGLFVFCATLSLAWGNSPAQSVLLRPSSTPSLKVVAMVGGRAVTERRVYLDLLVEKPELFSKQSSWKPSQEQWDESVERVIVQKMVEEENRITQASPPSALEVNSAWENWRKNFDRKSLESVLRRFDSNEAEIRSIWTSQRAVDMALRLRLRARPLGSGRESSRPSEVPEDQWIQEWLQQLKGRYRVQRLR